LSSASIPQDDFLTLTGTAQIFRIYRDVRFSKDPTPYKVRIALLLAQSARGVSVTASPRPLPPSHACMPQRRSLQTGSYAPNSYCMFR